MDTRGVRIDILKLVIYYIKRIWILAICGVIGFVAMYFYTLKSTSNMYTAAGTMYVGNGNPAATNYQYTSSNDLDSAVKLIDTYMVVIKSNKVLDVITERLAPQYPQITPGFIAGSLSAGSISETSVLQVRGTTFDPQLSADIVNAVLDVAPDEIIRVVGVGSCEVIDYAYVPMFPDDRGLFRRGIMGALFGIFAAGGVLLVLFLLDRRIADAKELSDSYTPPVLASIQREKVDEKKETRDQASFLLTKKSSLEKAESYAKLRMNMLYTLVGKEHKIIAVTSPVSGEGKTTIAANLAVSCAMGGKNVLLIDGDMRRACLREMFRYDVEKPGLSNILVGNISWQQAVLDTEYDMLHILPAGQLPPNPAELLGSSQMKDLFTRLEEAYELIIMDLPPVNVVADPLAVSSDVAGCLFVTRQNYTDHRDLRKALIAAEMTGMEVLGFIFYGENLISGNLYGYYSKKYYQKYYKNYYTQYDNRVRLAEDQSSSAISSSVKDIVLPEIVQEQSGETIKE